MTKRLIDRQRDAAVTMQIADESDTSAIEDMIPLPGRMLLIKKLGIWQAQLADNIDPGRTNPSIPNTMQKLLARGTADPLVGRTLLQAKVHLSQTMLPARIVGEAGLEVTFGLLMELDALDRKATDLQETLQGIEELFIGARATGGALQVPALNDVAARGKSFIQGADHTVRTLWQFVRVFHPELQKGVAWYKLKDRLMAGGDKDKALVPLIASLERPFTFLRNTRNAVEHPKPGQEVIFSDYRLRADGKVHAPSIEVIEKSTPLSETSLPAYFTSTVEMLVNAYQSLLINLCALHVQRIGGFDVEVIELEPDLRRHAEVKFYYASWLGERLVPYLG
jgi:hypothetical protein